MMAKFTKALRQQIIEDFARENNGWYDPRAFVAHVAKVGSEHPAYDWFTWDDVAAAEAFRLKQAREFASELVVVFKVEEVGSGPVRIVERTAPLLTSPEKSRQSGGGYYLTDLTDEEHLAELCRQAARDLHWFMTRYGAVVAKAGGDMASLQGLLRRLERAHEAKAA